MPDLNYDDTCAMMDLLGSFCDDPRNCRSIARLLDEAGGEVGRRWEDAKAAHELDGELRELEEARQERE